MLLLAIETSSRRGSVALFRHGELVREIVFPDGLVHGREITLRIAELLAASGYGPRDLAAIALSIGPGSFTGIRVGVTTAKTMAYALRIPVLTESSLRVTATNALASVRLPPAHLLPMRLLPVLDARQGAYFWGIFEIARQTESSPALVVRPLVKDAVDEPHRIAAAIDELGGDGMVIGEAAQAFCDRASSVSWERGPAAWDLPSARVLGELTLDRVGSAHFDLEAVHQLEPAYLRATEAERKLEAKGRT